MNKKGFTLIELMLVMAVLGILAAIFIPQFESFRERVKANKQIQVAKDQSSIQFVE